MIPRAAAAVRRGANCRTPWREARPCRIHVVHRDAQRGAGAAVAVMLRQVKHAVALLHAHVERRPLLEAMLEHQLEAEEVQVEILGPLLVEAAEDRSGMSEHHCAGSSPQRRLGSMWMQITECIAF